MNNLKKMVIICLSLMISIFAGAQTKTTKPNMKKKILFVVTSHGEKGNSGLKTGYYLSEVAHPWKVLVDAGYEIDFVSPSGGNPPVDGFDLKDTVNNEFWSNEYYHNKISHSMTPSQVKPTDYAAIYYAGGHGAMWDLPDNKEIAEIASKIYENNGIVGAVCHGPAGIINIKLNNSKYLIDGKKINGFTNEEERIVGLTDIVPFMLEDKLKEHGAIFEKSAPWQVHVVTDQRVVTGQNPQSAASVGEAIKSELQKLTE